MPITTTHLTRGAGLAAVAAGLLFAGVQINHPPLDLAFVTTTEFALRQGIKVAMSVLSLAGITGMYLVQVRRTGVLGLVGYLLFATGYLAMLTVEVAGLVVIPVLVDTAPGYAGDFIAGVTPGGVVTGTIGLLQPLNLLVGVGYMLGGLVFGIALVRAAVLARWASILLAVATVATVAAALPWGINPRLFAIPTAVALIGLGYSLWRAPRTQAAPAGAGLAEPVAVR